MRIRCFAWVISIQVRFLTWQVGILGRYCPDSPVFESVSNQLAKFVDEPQVQFKELPQELRIAISKLVVARRRGI